MKPADASAIAKFLKQGGEVLKIQEAIPSTEQEVLVYLASCGIRVVYSPSVSVPYTCSGKRHNLASLVLMANGRRRSQKLSPFALTPGSAGISQSRQKSVFQSPA